MGGQKLLPDNRDFPLYLTLVLRSAYLCRVYDESIMLGAFGIRPVEDRVIGIGPQYP